MAPISSVQILFSVTVQKSSICTEKKTHKTHSKLRIRVKKGEGDFFVWRFFFWEKGGGFHADNMIPTPNLLWPYMIILLLTKTKQEKNNNKIKQKNEPSYDPNPHSPKMKNQVPSFLPGQLTPDQLYQPGHERLLDGNRIYHPICSLVAGGGGKNEE